jgi:hypothetical protein
MVQKHTILYTATSFLLANSNFKKVSAPAGVPSRYQKKKKKKKVYTQQALIKNVTNAKVCLMSPYSITL